MMHEFTDASREDFDSWYGESEHTTRRPHDERTLYGKPCHETDGGCNERALYGKPQHEPSEPPNLPDIELLFVRMRAEAMSDPVTFESATTLPIRLTEQ